MESMLAIGEPRFRIDSDNKAGLIVIAAAIGVSWTTLTLIIRLVSKLHVNRTLGSEEGLVILASTFAIASSSCLLLAVYHGFGHKVETIATSSQVIVLKSLWLTDLFYLIALAIAKGAALPLLLRLTPIKKIVFACYALAFGTGCWGFVGIMLLGFRCHTKAPWNDISTQCNSLFGRWVAVEVLSILIEILLFALFVGIVAILRMRASAKIKVVMAFAIRLSIIIPAGLRLQYLNEGLAPKSDELFGLINAAVVTQTVLHYTTMAASFAYLKPFLRAFDSNFSATVKVDTIDSSGYPRGSRANIDNGKHDEEGGVMLSTLRATLQRQKSVALCNRSTPSGRDSMFSKSYRNSRLWQADAQDQKRRISGMDSEVSHEKHNSSESVTPIIMKTQEWFVHTESKDEPYHPM